MSDLTIVSSIVIFLTCLTFLNLLLPVAWRFITISSLAIFGTTTLITAGACIITSGVPCAIALGMSGLVNLLGVLLAALGITDIPIISDFFTSSSTYNFIGSLILTPISIILTIFIARLARGVAGGD